METWRQFSIALIYSPLSPRILCNSMAELRIRNLTSYSVAKTYTQTSREKSKIRRYPKLIVSQFLCYLGNPWGSCSLFIKRKYSLIIVSIRLPGTNIHKMCYHSGSLASIKKLQYYLLFIAKPKPAFQMRNAFPLITLG